MNTEQLQLFEEQTIRTAWDEEKEKWYFSIVDVVGALTESVDPTSYWRKLKQRLKEEGNETVTNCHALKMKAADGKRRFTDVANTEQLLRIIQSIPSKVAKPSGFEENKQVAHRGGSVVDVARKALEEQTGIPVITSQNSMQLNHVVEAMIEASVSVSHFDV